MNLRILTACSLLACACVVAENAPAPSHGREMAAVLVKFASKDGHAYAIPGALLSMSAPHGSVHICVAAHRIGKNPPATVEVTGVKRPGKDAFSFRAELAGKSDADGVALYRGDFQQFASLDLLDVSTSVVPGTDAGVPGFPMGYELYVFGARAEGEKATPEIIRAKTGEIVTDDFKCATWVELKGTFPPEFDGAPIADRSVLRGFAYKSKSGKWWAYSDFQVTHGLRAIAACHYNERSIAASNPTDREIKLVSERESVKKSFDNSIKEYADMTKKLNEAEGKMSSALSQLRTRTPELIRVEKEYRDAQNVDRSKLEESAKIQAFRKYFDDVFKKYNDLTNKIGESQRTYMSERYNADSCARKRDSIAWSLWLRASRDPMFNTYLKAHPEGNAIVSSMRFPGLPDGSNPEALVIEPEQIPMPKATGIQTATGPAPAVGPDTPPAKTETPPSTSTTPNWVGKVGKAKAPSVVDLPIKGEVREEDGVVITQLNLPQDENLHSVVWDTKGNFFYVAGRKGVVSAVSSDSLSVKAQIDFVGLLTFLGSGLDSILVKEEKDKQLHVLDPETLKIRTSIKNVSYVSCAAGSSRAFIGITALTYLKLPTGFIERKIEAKEFDTYARAGRGDQRTGGSGLESCLISSDPRFAIKRGYHGLCRYRIDRGLPVWEEQGPEFHSDGKMYFFLSPDGRYLATVSSGGPKGFPVPAEKTVLFIFRIDCLTIPLLTIYPKEWITDFAFDPSLHQLYAAGKSGNLYVYDANGEQKKAINMGSASSHIAVHPDGGRLLYHGTKNLSVVEFQKP